MHILPAPLAREFDAYGCITLNKGKRIYRIREGARTEIYNQQGKCIGYACAYLPDAPTCDRVVAEYLLLKNNERLYRRRVNLFHKYGDFTPPAWWAYSVLIVFDLMLLAIMIIRLSQ